VAVVQGHDVSCSKNPDLRMMMNVVLKHAYASCWKEWFRLDMPNLLKMIVLGDGRLSLAFGM
jgi:hypothetical protein